MRSDELIDRVRKAADIGSVASWPDFPDSRILQELTERHCQLMGDEEIRARAGYGVQTQTLVCEAGRNEYPVPSRAIGGAFEKLEIRGSDGRWVPLIREEVSGSEVFDLGPNAAGSACMRYSIRDGFVQLYPHPSAGQLLRFTFYIRPSQIVEHQSDPAGIDRGRITSINTTTREIVVNQAPFDQLLNPPAQIPNGNQFIDIVRPNGTFALAMYSVRASFQTVSLTFTLLGTESMQRVQIGDYVRREDQTDWPMGLPAESHRMVANRAAAEIARDIGVEEKVQLLVQTADADLQRFRRMRNPQVKSQPHWIPLRPMYSR